MLIAVGTTLPTFMKFYPVPALRLIVVAHEEGRRHGREHAFALRISAASTCRRPLGWRPIRQLRHQQLRSSFCLIFMANVRFGAGGLGLRQPNDNRRPSSAVPDAQRRGEYPSCGLIRCNSIRDTVQAQHKHIPRQRNGHHPRDSEP